MRIERLYGKRLSKWVAATDQVAAPAAPAVPAAAPSPSPGVQPSAGAAPPGPAAGASQPAAAPEVPGQQGRVVQAFGQPGYSPQNELAAQMLAEARAAGVVPPAAGGVAASGAPNALAAAGQAAPAGPAAAVPAPAQPVAVAVPGPAPAAHAGPLIASLAGAGLNVSGFQSDQQAAQAVVDAIAEGQRYRQMLVQQQLASQQTQQQPPVGGGSVVTPPAGVVADPRSTPAGVTPWWTPPEYNPQWAALVERDAKTGLIVPKDGVSVDIARKTQAYIDWRQQQEQAFYQNPVKLMEPGIREVVQPLIQQAIRETMERQEQQTHATQFVSQNSSWLFQRGQDGQVQYVPGQDGVARPALSAAGNLFAQEFQALKAAGVTNELQASQMALRYTQAEVARRTQAAAPPPVAPPPAPTPQQVNAQIQAQAAQQNVAQAPNGLAALGAAAQPNAPYVPPNRQIDVQAEIARLYREAFVHNGVLPAPGAA